MMRLYFTKMHGNGNDYIYINGMDERMAWLHRLTSVQLGYMARKLSSRHTGIGADGLILILPSQTAVCRMHMRNADGSRGAMCGNGIRCLARYVRDRGIAENDVMPIETDSGIKVVELRRKRDTVNVCVDMGGAVNEGSHWLNMPKERINLQLVSMGNPHCVIFTDAVCQYPLEGIGQKMQRLALFRQGVNVEIAEICSPDQIRMRVWERGSKETQSCGTGACAVCASAVWQGYCHYDTQIEIWQPGGCLRTVLLSDGRVLLEGPVAYVYEGVCDISREDLASTPMAYLNVR